MGATEPVAFPAMDFLPLPFFVLIPSLSAVTLRLLGVFPELAAACADAEAAGEPVCATERVGVRDEADAVVKVAGAEALSTPKTPALPRAGDEDPNDPLPL